MTKIEMARVIVQALYSLRKLPAATNVHVRRMASNGNRAYVAANYRIAKRIVDDAALIKELEN